MDHRIRKIYARMLLEDITKSVCIDRKAYIEFHLEWRINDNAHNALGENIEYIQTEFTAIEKL
jgi:hypothetical protein